MPQYSTVEHEVDNICRLLSLPRPPRCTTGGFSPLIALFALVTGLRYAENRRFESVGRAEPFPLSLFVVDVLVSESSPGSACYTCHRVTGRLWGDGCGISRIYARFVSLDDLMLEL